MFICNQKNVAPLNSYSKTNAMVLILTRNRRLMEMQRFCHLFAPDKNVLPILIFQVKSCNTYFVPQNIHLFTPNDNVLPILIWSYSKQKCVILILPPKLFHLFASDDNVLPILSPPHNVRFWVAGCVATQCHILIFTHNLDVTTAIMEWYNVCFIVQCDMTLFDVICYRCLLSHNVDITTRLTRWIFNPHNAISMKSVETVILLRVNISRTSSQDQ